MEIFYVNHFFIMKIKNKVEYNKKDMIIIRMCPISVEWARKPTLGSLQDVVCDGHGRGLRARLRPGALVLGDERK